MREVPLTKGYVALVDDEDYEALAPGKRWYANVNSIGKVRAMRSVWLDKKTTNVYMHREILGVVDPKVEVDHIDGNALNNTRGNLRLVSHRLNTANQRIQASRKLASRFKGVRPLNGRWVAHITNGNRRMRYIGGFKNELSAAAAYNAAAYMRFGEYARLNSLVAPGESYSVTNIVNV